jgi:hypothetical protein
MQSFGHLRTSFARPGNFAVAKSQAETYCDRVKFDAFTLSFVAALGSNPCAAISF